MIQIFLDNLENPNRPLLGPFIKGLATIGLWQPFPKWCNKIYDFFNIATAIFVCTEYIDLWMVRNNLSLVIINLTVTTLATITVFKSLTFRYWYQKKWKKLVNMASEAEVWLLNTKDVGVKTIILDYVRYSRYLNYSYWVMVAFTILLVLLSPLAIWSSSPELRAKIRNGTESYPVVISSWVPFNKTRLPGYFFASAIQGVCGLYGASVIGAWDALVVAMMIYFRGQLEVISLLAAKAMGQKNEDIDDAEAIRRVVECHRLHVYIVRNASEFSSVLSPVMFLYFIISSLMLCACGVQLTTVASSKTEMFLTICFLAPCIAQLFFFFWHGNDVLEKSREIQNSVWAGEWRRRGPCARRHALLLGAGLSRHVCFSAGPFNKMTISSFLMVLKGAYSYYTLLRNSEA